MSSWQVIFQSLSDLAVQLGGWLMTQLAVMGGWMPSGYLGLFNQFLLLIVALGLGWWLIYRGRLLLSIFLLRIGVETVERQPALDDAACDQLLKRLFAQFQLNPSETPMAMRALKACVLSINQLPVSVPHLGALASRALSVMSHKGDIEPAKRLIRMRLDVHESERRLRQAALDTCNLASLEQLSSLERGRHFYLQAIALDEGARIAWLGLIEVTRRLGDQNALDHLQDRMRRQFTAEKHVLTRLGESLADTDDTVLAFLRQENLQSLDEAVRVAEQEPLRIDPLLGSLRLNIEAALKEGENDLALSASKCVLALAKCFAKGVAAPVWRQREYGEACVLHGDCLAANGRFSESMRACLQGLEYFEVLCKADTQRVIVQISRAQCYEKLALIHEKRGNYRRALTAYSMARSIRYQLWKRDRANNDLARDYAVLLLHNGGAFMTSGYRDHAQQMYRKSLRCVRRLLELEPRNQVWIRDYSIIWERIGDALRQQGRLSRARRAYQHSLEYADRLAKQAPDSLVWQYDLALAYRRLGDICRRRRRWRKQVIAILDKELATISLLLKEQSNHNSAWRRAYAIASANLGEAYGKRDKEVSRRHWRMSVEIIRELIEVDPLRALWQTDCLAGYLALAKLDAKRDSSYTQSALLIIDHLSEQKLINRSQRDAWLKNFKSLRVS